MGGLLRACGWVGATVVCGGGGVGRWAVVVAMDMAIKVVEVAWLVVVGSGGVDVHACARTRARVRTRVRARARVRACASMCVCVWEVVGG